MKKIKLPFLTVKRLCVSVLNTIYHLTLGLNDRQDFSQLHYQVFNEAQIEAMIKYRDVSKDDTTGIKLELSRVSYDERQRNHFSFAQK